ncbi:MAG: glycoside hydrolase family 99-like domain-containing protein [Bacteroidales bacterium]|nr:glycoside hydrolase family 99-like domain-containing protein [Bacteroidales bacterium]
MKIIAFYLPQYHEIEENNRWWGKGFTEWTNVKKASPIFKNHHQPRVPLNENYYDLTNIETLQWQANLVRQYGLFGLCFYHYWFNGKLLLEKPAELLLQHTEINMNFCFSWANEPWTRTWSGKGNEVLMPQSYGEVEDWIRHFYYLLPFFKDARYIKINNSPLFLIYKSRSIPVAKEMMMKWNQLAKENGFAGIHFVETIRDKYLDKRDLPFRSRVEFEPGRSFNNSFLSLNFKRIRRFFIKSINLLFNKQLPYYSIVPYRRLVKRSLTKLSPIGTFGGVFVGWDNTPRRGIEGLIVSEATKEEFKNYLKAKIQVTKNHYRTDFVFVNAWNEWCEGAYLEPDTKNKFIYLESIKEVLDELN